jgi:hypothetical protein
MHFNNASSHPTPEVRRLIDLAAEPYDLRGVCVYVQDTPRTYRGLAYRNIPHNLHRKFPGVMAGYAVMIAVGAAAKYRTSVSNLRVVHRWVRVTAEEYAALPAGIATRGSMTWVNGSQEHWMEKRIERTVPYGGLKAPVVIFNDWMEAMVGVAAHEFHHIQQFRLKVKPREWYCERAAAEALTRYRAKKAGGCYSPGADKQKDATACTLVEV